MQQIATVQYGSIYLNNTMYDSLGFIFDVDIGLIKYGPLTGEHNIRDYYTSLISKQPGYSSNFLLLELDPYESGITIEEICTILNYFILFKPLYSEVSSLFLEQDPVELKSRISKLQSLVEIYQKRNK